MGVNDEEENVTNSRLDLETFHEIFVKVDPNIKINSFEVIEITDSKNFAVILNWFSSSECSSKFFKWIMSHVNII